MAEVGKVSLTSGSSIRHFDAEGREEFPCRCGQTHRGDYGFYDWMHHNCLHDEPLLRVEELAPHLMCPLCGEMFAVEDLPSSSGLVSGGKREKR